MNKKLSKIFAPILVASSVAPMALTAIACAQEQGIELHFENAYKDAQYVKIGAASYTVSSRKLIPNKENKITVTLDQYSSLTKFTSGRCFEIFQTNPLGKKPGLLTEGTDYTVNHTDGSYVYEIVFSAEQSKNITKEMTVRFNASYAKVEMPVEFGPTGGTEHLVNTLSSTYIYNPYVCSDYSFLIFPKFLNSGYDTYEKVLTNMTIKGVKNGDITSITNNVKKEKAVAYYKMQNVSELYPTLSHYMKVSVPNSELFVKTGNEYTPKYDKLIITGTEGCGVRGDATFANRFVINPSNCTIVDRSYKYDDTLKNVAFTMKLVANDGYSFHYDETSGSRTLPITSLRIQGKNSMFKELLLTNSAASETSIYLNDAFFNDDTTKEEFFYGLYYDKYPKLNNWLTFTLSTTTKTNDTLTIKINVGNMIKYTQMPNDERIAFEKFNQYAGCSIDFMDYLSMDVVAKM